jgi:carboxyl-terminal processing protease
MKYPYMKNTRQRLFASIAFPLVLALSSSLAHSIPLKKQAFEPTRDQAVTTLNIVEQLARRHYLSKPIDDELSSRMLDEYLNKLDPGRDVFLTQDIKEFESFRFQLDDSVKKGDLTSGFIIFNRFHQRRKDRLEEIVGTLPEQVKAMDFTLDESLDLDRKGDAWPRTDAEAKDLWRQRLKAAVLSLTLSGKDQDKIIELLTKRYKNQLSRINDLNSEDVFQLYINSLTNLYDPHTSYLSPSLSDNFNINMSLSLEGIGAVLQKEDEYTKVVRIVHAGPADKQGQLKPAHRIIGVAQGEKGEMVDVIGWRLDDVVKLIRGPKNSLVRLSVLSENAKTDAESFEVKIERNEVKLEEQAAQKKVIDIENAEGQMVKVGVIDIPAFYIDFDALRRGDRNYKSTTRDVRILLNELIDEGVQGIVIDLRDNGGGSLREANELTGLFIEHGPTVQIRDARNHVERRQKLPQNGYYDGPLLVLINRLSASASEIFAGALQDYQRAVIVGGQSFGKGTVQSLSHLRQGQLKLTESKFYRISGESTQHRGVVPDIAFPALYDYDEVGESALDGALEWDTIKPAYYRTYFNIPSVLSQLEAKHQSRIEHNPDFAFIKSQLQLKQDLKDIAFLSLNQSTRKQEDDEYKAKLLVLENKRRRAKGEPELSSFDELDSSKEANEHGDQQANNDSDAKQADEKDAAQEDKDDVFLTEASSILVDAIHLFDRQVTASRSGAITGNIKRIQE